MKFTISSVIALALAASTTALPTAIPTEQDHRSLSLRQAVSAKANALNGKLLSINKNIGSLTTTTKGYNGGLMAATGVADKANALDSSIKSATTAVKATQKLNSADSGAVIKSVNTITPSIDATINALVSKKSQFASAGVQGIVSDQINSLKTDTSSLAVALKKIISNDKQKAVSDPLASIAKSFKKATVAYSS